jgi:hypothetical protein
MCITNYKDTKVGHNITGDVIVVLGEDDIRVKSKIAWDSKHDNLTSFCTSVKVDRSFVVGIEEVSYNKVLDVFTNNVTEAICIEP